jgi:acyl-CoA reductase-like NAD-dependent aldehyde dehydrogenase
MTEFRSVDPSTGQLVAERPETAPDDLERAIALCEAAYRTWSVRSLADRAEAVKDLGVRIAAGRERYAMLMAEEVGKPLTQGLAEIDKCAAACTVAADRAADWLAPRSVRTEAETSYIRHDPMGPILAVMPWNFPFWQVIRFAAPTLLAGNTVILKHAPNAPRCAEALALLFDGGSFPAGALVNVLVKVDEIERIVADPRVAGATLTGSTRAGRSLAAVAGRHLKPSVLELGGSDPFVVFEDADLELAARTAAAARLQNNGQSCIAAKRFLVHRSVADELVERLRLALEAAVTGDPRDPATTVGPLARRDLRDHLHGQVTASVRQGARCVLGGEIPTGADGEPRQGFWYPPTLLLEAGPGMPVWDDEVFGPVAPVRTFDDESEAVAVANGSSFGLGATLFTSDRGRAEALARQLRCGSVFVNAMVRSDPRLPFGGIGDSGWGRELGREGILAFTHTKTVWVAG